MPQNILVPTWEEHAALGMRVQALEVSVANLAARVTALEESGPPPEPEPKPVVILEFKVTPDTVEEGQSAAVSWKTEHATGLTLNGAAIPQAEWASGIRTYNPAATTTYRLQAEGHGGPMLAEATLTVTEPEPPEPPEGPKLTVAEGETVTLGPGTVRYPDGIDNQGEIVCVAPLRLIVGKALDSTGKFTMVGTYKSHMRRTVSDMKAGDRVLTLTEPAHNWNPGDKLWVPDTRQLTSTSGWESHSEEVEIESVAGATITLKAPMQRHHLGNADIWPIVSMLSHDIQVEDEEGNRCHAMFHLGSHHDQGDHHRPFSVMVCNVEWRLRGITTVEPLTAPGGTNPPGSYGGIHCHLLGAHGSAVMIKGNSFSPYTPAEFVAANVNTLAKWGGVILHGTQGATVQKNVVRCTGGSGIVTEDAAAQFNVVEDNLVTDSRGNGTRVDKNHAPGVEGSGYYLAGVHNYFRRNISMAHVNAEAVNFFSGGVDVPTFLVNEGWEVWSSKHGVGIWRQNADDLNYNPAFTARNLIKDTTICHVRERGMNGYPMMNVDFDGWRVRGAGVVGMHFTDYFTINCTVSRADIQGNGGINCPASIGDTRIEGLKPKTFVIRDSFFAVTYEAIGIQTPWGVGAAAQPATTEIINTRFLNCRNDVSLQHNTQGHNPGINYVQSNMVLMRGCTSNGEARPDSRIWWAQQAADFQPLPITSGNVVGFPPSAAGMRHDSAAAIYGIAMYGSVAPPGLVTWPRIAGGLVGPVV